MAPGKQIISALLFLVASSCAVGEAKARSDSSSSSSLSDGPDPICFTSPVGLDHCTTDGDETVCVTLPRHCQDLLDGGCTVSGEYTIYPTLETSIEVFCDQETDGGGWTVIQRRSAVDLNFVRDWDAYAAGFGDVAVDFWLGLENIHLLTSTIPQEVWFDMEATSIPDSAFAHYTTFEVGDSGSNYQLTVSDYDTSSTAGDSFTYHSGMAFSTYDADNDAYAAHCAVIYEGAWWHKTCHMSNPNGHYLDGETTTYADGVIWKTYKGYYYSLEYIDMKIRPK